MYASVDWINAYLDPPAPAQEQAALLTRAGFPLEGREEVEGDVRQDFEMTSNRGDCVCHLGLAREIAAISCRKLRPPVANPGASGPSLTGVVSVTNEDMSGCPLYTARLIRGITVGPSPDWLDRRLRSIGQIPRNNIVDASNFVLFEMGQPTHVFDLARLAGPAIIIRRARAGETILPIGEAAEPIELTEADLVIADHDRPIAVAGVKGGAESAVTAGTTDIVVEAATFDPVTVRESSRRLGLSSDSAYRFERGVHPGSVEDAANRLVELILEVAGGELAEGVLTEGRPIPERRRVEMRVARCRRLVGVDIEVTDILDSLDRLGFDPTDDKGKDVKRRIRSVVPVHRLDVEREVDLIEEVSRMMGHDTLPIEDSIRVRVAPLEPTELARRAIGNTLEGLGFIESITHSMILSEPASAFLPTGTTTISVLDAAPGAEHTLRPSLLPSLLRVRAHNLDNGVRSLRLFESAAVYAGRGEATDERQHLTLLMDLETPAEGIRPLRGVVDRLIRLLEGPSATLSVQPDACDRWYEPGAAILLGERRIGQMGLLTAAALASCDLEVPQAAAELELADLMTLFPPETPSRPLASYPAVERDVSVIVSEATPWSSIEAAVRSAEPLHMEAVEFVSIYRGKQIGSGRKSVLARMRFRAADHTLTNDAVDLQVVAVHHALERTLDAEIRRTTS